MLLGSLPALRRRHMLACHQPMLESWVNARLGMMRTACTMGICRGTCSGWRKAFPAPRRRISWWCTRGRRAASWICTTTAAASCCRGTCAGRCCSMRPASKRPGWRSPRRCRRRWPRARTAAGTCRGCGRSRRRVAGPPASLACRPAVAHADMRPHAMLDASAVPYRLYMLGIVGTLGYTSPRDKYRTAFLCRFRLQRAVR